ncbi:type III secretion system chaperone family protein [Georgenia subflava]|uniref:YbjN domain-containing protein n=1 Tax=Georgenia subflava TaxID=1622177 RepID=A0A6N7EG99_9MICO|nr:YbjN domain-containing protein [Georgenia subflava]MPV37060.1 YbjN domain-containing protein [Georgenia subflava]
MGVPGGFDEGRRPVGPARAPAGGAEGSAAARDVIGPLTRDRVAQALTQLGYPLFRDAAGDLGAMWAQAVFHVYLLGTDESVLQVRGTWHRRLAIERLGEVLEMIDRWNREFIGPKTYVRVLDDGFLSVVAETSTPLTSGVSDRQLARFLERGVGQGMRVMRDLEATYPDPAARPPEER